MIMRTNTGPITISQPLVWSILFDNTQKKLTQLDILYKNEDKVGGRGDNFTFKLSVFYDEYQLIGFLSNSYLDNASFMLTSEA